MTRKHFKRLAEILVKHESDLHELPGPDIMYKTLVIRMADFCKSMNPNFNYEVFYEACGTPEIDEDIKLRP